MRDIVVIGASGLAKEAAFLLKDINSEENKWNILGFIDNDENNIGKIINGFEVIGTDKWFNNLDTSICAVFAIGNPLVVQNLSKKLVGNNFLKFPNIVHPGVVGDWENIKMGIGNVICAGNVLTTSIVIGDFNYFNLSCTLGHDLIIGNGNIINPMVSISGGVKIEDGILIGTGTQILQYLTISKNLIVGASSLVTKDLVTPGTYIGVPAKKFED